jgi:hypothetical protein
MLPALVAGTRHTTICFGPYTWTTTRSRERHWRPEAEVGGHKVKRPNRLAGRLRRDKKEARESTHAWGAILTRGQSRHEGIIRKVRHLRFFRRSRAGDVQNANVMLFQKASQLLDYFTALARAG